MIERIEATLVITNKIMRHVWRYTQTRAVFIIENEYLEI
jgi:hypothetical protein